FARAVRRGVCLALIVGQEDDDVGPRALGGEGRADERDEQGKDDDGEELHGRFVAFSVRTRGEAAPSWGRASGCVASRRRSSSTTSGRAPARFLVSPGSAS